jgi:rfaE bifunctional protein kinase chain/domain
MIVISHSRLKDIVTLFNGKRIMVLGDLMVDEYLTGKVSRISPEAPVPVVDISEQLIRLGGAANVGYNLLHLGCQPILVGAVGQDRMGEQFLDILRENRMVIDGIVTLAGRPTTVKTRIIGHSQHIVRIDKESCEYISGSDEAKLIEIVSTFLKDVDAIIIQDYNKGVLSGKIIDYTVKISQKYKKLITVDPKFINFFHYKNVTVFKPNIREIENVFALHIKNQDDLISIGRQLIEKLKAECVLITRGSEGMSLFEAKKEPVHVSTRARKVADVSGAGDTVISTLTAALIGGASYQEAATLANYAAGIVCEEVGIVPISLDKLYQVCLGSNSQ